MSKLDDLYQLHRLLDGRRTPISRATLMDQLSISRSKLTRLLADLRDKLGAPILCDRERGGYRYDTTDGRHALPGLWFTSAELHALITLHHLLQTLQPGLLDAALAPIRMRLDALLKTEHLGSGEAQKRIRILAMAASAQHLRHFQTVAATVLQRTQMSIHYYNRERDETRPRQISLQRLTHYRDNWYLDAWCHASPAQLSGRGLKRLCGELLGVGWNFAFIGGTTLLVQTYRPTERLKVQAVNEFSVFGLAALATLSAGWLYDRFDWITLNLAMMPLLLAALIATFGIERRLRRMLPAV